MRLYKRLFFLLVFLLPVNLGKHYIIRESYVYGLLVDYLIPTVFVQDLLVLLLLIVWIITLVIKKEVVLKIVNPVRHKRFFQILVLFFVTLLFSVINSGDSFISWTYLIRTVLYATLSLFIYSEVLSVEDFSKLNRVLSLSVICVSLLGIAQFVMRGSVFDNYLVFGEQPYDLKTRNLNFEYLFGKKVIPPYGLFRHPNVFGGYLSILMTMFFVNLGIKQNVFDSKKYKVISIKIPKITSNSLFAFIAMFLGTLTLVLTFSYITLTVYLFGLVFVFFKSYKRKGFYFLSLLLISVFTLLPFMSSVWFFSRYSSLYRRSGLLESSYIQFRDNIMYGVGYGLSTDTIEDISRLYSVARFVQPVHNIFALLFSEGGIFTGIFFILLFMHSLKSTRKNVFAVCIVQLLLLGCLDHYFFTSHQMHLLMWILLGLSLLEEPLYDYN